MATKKREIYSRAAVQLRTNERAIRAERQCPGAMGLYFFLLLDARGEETYGDVAEDVALASWAGKESYRSKQAAALIAYGLVERRDDRLHVLRYDEHNDTPSEIDVARSAARDRKRKERGHGDVTRDAPVTHAEVPCSSSISPDSRSSGSDPDLPDRLPTPQVGAPARGPFAPGTAGAVEALNRFQDAVATATGRRFALNPAPFHPKDLCALLNAHAPPGSMTFALAWLWDTVAAWVGAVDPKYVGGWTPSKLLDWLNAGRPERASPRKSDAQITRQPADLSAPWLQDDYIGKGKTGT